MKTCFLSSHGFEWLAIFKMALQHANNQVVTDWKAIYSGSK
ncbi:hypothetical protein [Candidatus Coxiella mudrowiae]|nr:hypothetical protein [Candidatus Coxiella mudrowiae]